MIFLITLTFKLNAQESIKKVDSIIAAHILNVYENPDESINFGNSVMENNTYPDNTKARANMLISFAYTSKRDYRKALEYIIKSKNLSKNVKNRELQLEILFKTAVLYQQLKVYDKALEDIQKAEQIILTYPPTHSVYKNLPKYNILKAIIYKDNLNCEIALDYFDRALKLYEKYNISNPANQSIAYYNQGNCYSLLSELNLAKSSFSKAISFAQKQNANSLVAFAQKGLAEVYFMEGDYQKAIDMLQQALDKNKSVNDMILNLGIYEGLFENNLALNKWGDYQKYYDLYLKTQKDIKQSERSSISDFMFENSEIKKEIINDMNSKFKTLIFSAITIVTFLFFIFLFKRNKNKKAINTLQNQISTFQNASFNSK